LQYTRGAFYQLTTMQRLIKALFARAGPGSRNRLGELS